MLEAHAWWVHCGRPLFPEQSARCLDAFAWLDRLHKEARTGERREAERERVSHHPR